MGIIKAYIERRGERGYFIWADSLDYPITGQGASIEEAMRSFELEAEKMADDLEWDGKKFLARELRCSLFDFFRQCKPPKNFNR